MGLFDAFRQKQPQGDPLTGGAQWRDTPHGVCSYGVF